LLAGNPHGGEHLKDLLVGQILWVSYSQLLPVALLTVVILALWYGARARLGRIGFYAMFAIAVTASVQLVGIYLVFASLILPALATYRLEAAQRLTWGYAAGAGGYAIGITASALFDLPTGAVTVWTLALTASVTALLAPRLHRR
jgi:zinc/manganese transport system permease protein